MHSFGHARALPAEKDRVVGRKDVTMERYRPGGRHQDQSRPGITIGEVGLPGGMSPDSKICRVIEGGALKTTVVEEKAARLDQIDLDTETGRKTHESAGILRYVRLEQREAQTTSRSGLDAGHAHHIGIRDTALAA